MRKKSLSAFVILFLAVFLYLLLFSTISDFWPWRGVVLDSETGDPIEGAVVVRSWYMVVAGPAGPVSSFLSKEETLSDEHGKFLIFKKSFHVVCPLPLLTWIEENKPIVFKPGYKFLVLDDKPSEVVLEKVPTFLEIRKEEADKAYGNYETFVHKTEVFLDVVMRENEFIQNRRPTKRVWTSFPSRSAAREKGTRKATGAVAEAEPRIKDPEAVERLINELMNENPERRKRAAEILGKMEIHDPQHVEALRKVIKAKFESQRFEPRDMREDLKNIAKIGAPVVPLLFDELKRGNVDIRRKALSVMARIKDPEAVTPLIRALDSEDPGLRRIALSNLYRFQDTAAVDALIGALRDDDWKVRKTAAHNLGVILKEDRALGPLIVASRDEEPQVRRKVAIALGELQNPIAVETLIALLEDKDNYVRIRAAGALAKIQDPRAKEPLLRKLRDQSWRVRKSAVSALAAMADKKVVEALIETWNDEVQDVRIRAAEVLVAIGSPSVEPLITVLKHEDSYFRWRAAWALGKIIEPKAVDHLIPLLNDNTSEVRWIAVGALVEFKGLRPMAIAKAIPQLIAVLNDDDPGIRAKAAKSLFKITGKDFREDALKWQRWWKENKETIVNQKSLYPTLP